jgi:hypothetical protein
MGFGLDGSNYKCLKTPCTSVGAKRVIGGNEISAFRVIKQVYWL